MNIERINYITDLLRRIVQSYTHEHEQLSIQPTAQPDGVRFVMQVHADDYPKVCGKKGSALQALAFVLREFGVADGVKYQLTLWEPKEDDLRGPERIITPPEEYDPSEPMELLNEILSLVYAGADVFQIEDEQVVDGYKFVITTRDPAPLLKSYANDRSLTLLAALQRLMKSYAGCVGLHFYLEMESV